DRDTGQRPQGLCTSNQDQPVQSKLRGLRVRRKRMESDLTATGNGPTSVPAAQHGMSGGREYSDEEVRQLVAALEEPFDPRDIKWRVTSTSSDRRRGQMMACADPRAYSDALKHVCT